MLFRSFFNFLSSHDGIGLQPARGILSEEQIEVLLKAALTNGGKISRKDNGDGTTSPYEMNINYQDALASPEESDETRIGRFLAAETILLSLQGVPGIYIHSLLGSRNDYLGREESGISVRFRIHSRRPTGVSRRLCAAPQCVRLRPGLPGASRERRR